MPRNFVSLLILSTLCFVTCAWGQIEMQVDHKGEFRRVIGIRSDTLIVEDSKGRAKKSEHERTRFVAAESYAEGFVDVDFGEARDPRVLKNNKMKAGKNSFEMTISLTADRNVSNCFFLLLFQSNDALATYYDSVGSLRAGKKRKIAIKMPAQVDAIGSLHIFERGRELRTGDSIAGRSLEEEYETLLDRSSGVPAVALFQRVNHYPHVVSPNGKLVATYRDDKTHHRLVVFDVESLSILQSVEVGEYDEAVSDLEWLSDEVLLFIADRELNSLHAFSGKVELLEGRETLRILRVLPDSTHAVTYSHTTKAIGRGKHFATVDCVKGKRVLLEIGELWDACYLDANGRLRLKQQYSDGQLEFRYRDGDSKRWRDLEHQNNELEIQFTRSGKDEVDHSVYVEGFGGDENTLIVSAHRGGDKYSLCRYNIESGKVEEVLWQDDEYDVGGDYPAVDLFRNRNYEVIGIGYWKDRYKVVWFDPRFEAAQRQVESALPHLQHKPISWDLEGKAIVFRSFGDQSPGEYYLYSEAAKSLRNLYTTNLAILDQNLATTRPIHVEARDGQSILCYLTTPPDWDGTPLPLIASIHGGPTSRDLLTYSPITQFYATRGFAILEVNYRGSAGFGRAFKLDGIVGNLDTTPIDDIADAVNWAIENGIAQKARVAIVGGSWGGYSVYMSMVRYPELYRCGVATAAPSHMKAMLRNDLYVHNRFKYHFWKEILESRVDSAYIERVSPVNYVDAFQRPILIIQGERDRRVDIDQARIMSKAMEKAGKEYALILYPEDGHGHDAFGWNHSLNETEAFILTHMGL
ncbi:prolyl oligopeptidase family serine peptidase [Pelagicoccus sp. SDUM812003]|uniref:alpha/beta hydrolase family protein n=1 Tax=Pelagicoccus sp. SDUM812003 TaxID=3041267 RepID=UPI00280C8C7E|nr:prolyl oligopeptidase family serine peptidase [Pelagicoccus sp. SDUM812003]MDQ8204860.1 prolyl oligopeptidase family serine peptidase [Pelagicoccus sp. SDUM812003]